MAQVTKSKALERLRRALNDLPELKNSTVSPSGFQIWHRNTRIALESVFGKNSDHVREFVKISFDPVVVKSKYGSASLPRFASGLVRSSNLLKSMIHEIEEYWQDRHGNHIDLLNQVESENGPSEIFLVHGRDSGAKEMVARFLEKMNLKPVILAEQINVGKTIIEKFEYHANVGFAIVLMTPDDIASILEEEGNLYFRARQNVIFELGFFVGKLGRQRVCALIKGDVEIPSDYSGVVYIELDPQEGWKLKLIHELKFAGFSVDANRVK